jgi:polyisoprenoid-binding protein YceI
MPGRSAVFGHPGGVAASGEEPGDLGGRGPAPAGPEIAGPGATRLVLGIAALVLILVGVTVVAVGLTRRSAAPEPELTATGTTGTATRPVTAEDLRGTWTLAADGQSYVGYRIDETYVGVAAPEPATGRTTAVQGVLQIEGDELASVAIEADLTELASGDPDRDAALRTRGLETERHPRAVFATANRMRLPAVPPPGRGVPVTVTGELNLHGTVRPVTLQLEVQVIPGDAPVIEVVGTHAVTLAEFGIEPPDVAGLLTVSDRGNLELKLRFVRAG